MHMTTIALLAALIALAGMACSEDSNNGPAQTTPSMDMAPDLSGSSPDMTPLQDMRPAQDMRPDAGPDMSRDMAPERDMTRFEPGTLVPMDLDPFKGALPGATQGAKVAMASAQDLLTGDVALAKQGDYFLENEHGRYLIEGIERAMSPCPFGGTVVDAAYKNELGVREDNLGEICLLINISQTFAPERYEVINPGSATDPAVLAVTGHLAQHDFLNFEAQVKEFLPTVNLPIDLNAVFPVTVTTYYILQPGARALQVVAALRNDGEERLDMVTGHLVASGGAGGYFNPLGGESGFGNRTIGSDNLDGYDLPYMLFRGETSSYGYVPDVDPKLSSPLPSAGVHLTQSGAVATLLGRGSLAATLLIRKSQLKNLSGALHLEPGEVGEVRHQLYVGDGAISTMLDHIYPSRELETGRIRGIARDTAGVALGGARVSAIDATGLAINQAITDASGAYELVVPVGSYSVKGRLPGQPTLAPVSVEVEAAGEHTADLALELPSLLEITITTPDGQPTPGRVSVICEGPCPNAPTSQEEDVSTDPLPDNFAAILPAGVDGKATGALPAGDYRVVVSRGMEWSLWPQDAQQSKGAAVTLSAGETTQVAAEIAHVVRTPGAMSGDFHIHSLTSTDSAVGLQTRVLDFMTEGVDVMVSTDHDYITDYAPAIAALGAQAQIVSMIGNEITTSDAGHINGFPLEIDPAHRRNGALDWGNGEESGLLPTDIFAWIQSFPGEQVSQINHPSGGTITSLKVDTLHGVSFADPVLLRLPQLPVGADGDTRLWSEDFTAMEIFNGHSMERFWEISRWWMTMVGRGFSPTVTAVSDTHKLYADLGGAPRSFVFMGEGADEPATFDSDRYARAINAGRVIGSNGPFFTVTLENAAGDKAAPGDVLDATQDEKVTARVHIELPEWIKVDVVDIYTNRTDVIVPAGQTNDMELVPDKRVNVDLVADDLKVVTQGESQHRRWEKDITFELDVTEDAYVVVIVRQLAPGNTLYPVVTRSFARPFAFANPIYVDKDGGGWNTYPLAGLAASMMPMAPLMGEYELPPMVVQPHVHRGPHAHAHHHGHRVMTREELGHVVDHSGCDH